MEERKVLSLPVDRIFLVIYLTLLSILSFAQKANYDAHSIANRKNLKEAIKTLTSDSLDGRLCGTEGQRKAAKFIANKFETLGLQGVNQSGYFQKFKLIETSCGEVYLKAGGRKLSNFKEVIQMDNISSPIELEKEIIFGGHGNDDELEQIYVKDRIVFVFTDNLRAYYKLAERLKKRNAFGVILANPENDKQFGSIKKTYKNFKLQKKFLMETNTARLDSMNVIHEFLIPNSEIKNVTGLSKHALKELIASGNIKDCPISKIQLKCEKIIKEVETENVFGFLKGKSDSAIIISAHYDHLGRNENARFPGADDNASGVAALLALAELFSSSKELENTMVFLATTAEEEGLLGSSFFVNSPFFKAQNTLCNLNLDMIGRIDSSHNQNDNYLYCIGTDSFKKLDIVVRKADSLYNDCRMDFNLNNSKDIAGYYTRSDQYSFYKKGVPAIHFFSGVHEDYHKPTDTFEKINYGLLQNRIKLISIVIDILQNSN